MSADLLIESNDGQLFLVGAQAARQSALFKDLLVFTPADAAESVEVNNNNSKAESTTTTEKRKPSFTCKTVDGHTMALVLEWLEHHQDEDIEEKVADDGPFRERPLPEWDAAFFAGRVGRGWAELAPLIEAASYLNIDKLVKYTAKAIADQMSGMSTEQMRVYAGVQVTKEEVASLEKWVDMDMSGDQLVDINSKSNSDNGDE